MNRTPKKILFIFDRVAHYHRELFRTLESRLKACGITLFLLSGEVEDAETGRVGLCDRVIRNESKYQFVEIHVGSFIFRRHKGVDRKIEAIRPDLIVMLGHVGNISNWHWLVLKRKRKYKVVAWQCGYEFNPGKVKDVILKLFIPRFDYHLAYHTNAKNYALKYGAPQKAITVIHNTINEQNIDLLPKPLARSMIEAKHPVLRDKKILLYVGAILEEKRLPSILEALSLLRREDLAALFVGDGPYMYTFRKLCAGRSDVVLAGSIIDGVGAYFDAADCFILPGTGGLAINEAMAHALPVISGYADGSADDLVVNGENGFRLRSGSHKELAEKIQAVIDNKERAKQMGEMSRKKIVGVFSFSNFIDRICFGLTTALE